MRAFLVVGPESSGTRFLTSLLVASGCKGSPELLQPLNFSHPTQPLVVVRRSLPYGKVWPDLPVWEQSFLSKGYETHALLCVRSRDCVLKSQVKTGHTSSLEESEVNYLKAWREVFWWLSTDSTLFTLVPYESLSDPVAQKNLLLSLHLPPVAIPFEDGNLKHRAGHLDHPG